MSERHYLIIIPAFNEQDSIGAVIDAAKQHAASCDIVIVDDGSSDDTALVASMAGARLLRLPCNLGYARAVQTGMKYATAREYDVVVLLDSDGQHDPKDIPALISTLEREGADVVIGSRFAGGRKLTGPLGRRLGMWLFSWITSLITGHRIYDTTSGFKAIKQRAYIRLAAEQFVDFHAEALVSLSFAGMRIVECPVVMAERKSGRSMYGWISHVSYPLKTMLLIVIAVFKASVEGRGKH